MAADARAATPTEAAGMAVPDSESLAEAVTGSVKNIYKSAVGRFNFCLGDLRRNAGAMFGAVSGTLNAAVSGVKYAAAQILGGTERKYLECESLYARLYERADAKNPLKLLKSGYAAVAGEDGKALSSVKGLYKGENIYVVFSDGKAAAQVKDTFLNEIKDGNCHDI
jgi:exonuclease VII large subunit